METRPFREAHADLFEPAPLHADQFRASLPLLTMLGRIDQAGVHLMDGRIIFIGGWAESAPGVAELFIYPSVYAARYPKTFYREVKWWVEHLKRQYRRVQCWGEDTELSRRWLSRLGFSCEGVLRGYTVSGSMTIWGIV